MRTSCQQDEFALVVLSWNTCNMFDYKSLASYKVVLTTVISLAVLLSRDCHKVDNVRL